MAAAKAKGAISRPDVFYRSCVIGVIAVANGKRSDLSMDSAVNVLKLCEKTKGHDSLVNQLERSSTSIGANISEANYAHSKPDFIAKLQIALKECRETEYWLELMKRSGILEENAALPLLHDCGSIRRMIISSINTAKENADKGVKQSSYK